MTLQLVAPANLSSTPAATADASIRLQWTAITGATTYRGEVAVQDAMGVWGSWSPLFPGQATLLYDWFLAPLAAGIYQARVFATVGGVESLAWVSPYITVKHVADWLYGTIPELTRERDRVAGAPLQQLLNVLGVGLSDVKSIAESFAGITDVDSCPANLLPFLGAMLGFEFPYDLSEDLQRNFIRSIIGLYRMKGTQKSMRVVVTRMIAGQGFTLDIINEDHVAKTFLVELTTNEDNALSVNLQNKIVYLVNLYSPAGMIPSVAVAKYTTEIAGSTSDDATQATNERGLWRTNVGWHTLNTRMPSGDIVGLNEYGTTALTI